MVLKIHDLLPIFVFKSNEQPLHAQTLSQMMGFNRIDKHKLRFSFFNYLTTLLGACDCQDFQSVLI